MSIQPTTFVASCTSSRALSHLKSPRLTSLVPRGGASLERMSSTESNGISISSMLQRSSTALASLPHHLAQAAIAHPVKLALGAVFVLAMLALTRYQENIKRRLRVMKEESLLFGAGVSMERILDSENKIMTDGPFQNMNLLELNPEFQEKYAKDWQLTTLGDYLSSLRPKGLPKKFSVGEMPEVMQREIEAGLAAGLLKALGPNMGRILLPAVGAGFVQRKAEGLASKVATDWFLDDDERDKAGLPLSLMTLLTIADNNAKFNGNFSVHDHELEETAIDIDPEVEGTSPDNAVENDLKPELSSIQKMTRGEVVKGPSFVDKSIPTANGGVLVPNEFIVSQHFEQAIYDMEAHLAGNQDGNSRVTPTNLEMAREAAVAENQKANLDSDIGEGMPSEVSAYDPEDRRLPEPVPVNPRLFPGLHLGFGKAISTHTKREVLKMRLLSVIFNKLGSNYYKRMRKGNDKLFSVRMSEDSPAITTPWEFTQMLTENGNEIEVVPTSRMTAFGIGMCIKEADDSWTNVPLGVFLESGYEDKDGNMALVMMPHSGVNMYIRGPLAGSRRDGTLCELNIQHSIGIEGFCGWKADAIEDEPYNELVAGGERLSGSDAVRATRLAGLYGIALNGLATELELPFGGYGATAVCNDSAAIIQKCLYGGDPTIYPLTSIGRFAQRTIRYAKFMRNELTGCDNMEMELSDLVTLTDALKNLPSDINAAPSNAVSAAKRMLHTLQPKLALRLMTEAKEVMESILEEEELDKAASTSALN